MITYALCQFNTLLITQPQELNLNLNSEFEIYNK